MAHMWDTMSIEELKTERQEFKDRLNKAAGKSYQVLRSLENSIDAIDHYIEKKERERDHAAYHGY